MQCLSARSSHASSRLGLPESKLSGFQSPSLMRKSLLRLPIEKVQPSKEAAKKLGTKNNKKKIGKIPNTRLKNPPLGKPCFNLSELFCVQAKKEQDKQYNDNLAELYDAYLSDPTLEDQREL